MGKERTIESFQGFFTAMGKEVIATICSVCSDMWEPYLKLIREQWFEALRMMRYPANLKKAGKALCRPT